MTGVLDSDPTVGSASNGAAPLPRRESRTATTMLTSRFPKRRGPNQRPRCADLAAPARVRAHLIALTLYR